MTEHNPVPPAILIAFERGKMCHETQAGYGRWIIGSLLVIHGAAIGYGAGQETLRVAMSAKFWLFPSGGFVFAIIGLLCALISGMGAWLNWGASATELDYAARTALIQGDVHPDLNGLIESNMAKRGANLSILMVICSTAMIGLTAIAVILGLPQS